MEKDTEIFEELVNLEALLSSAVVVEEKSLEEEFDDEPVFDEYYEGEIFEHYSNIFDTELELAEKEDGSFEDCCGGSEIDDDIEQKTLPCWEGYVQLGMKKGKNGKMVPNCVPMKKKSALKDPEGGLTAAGRKFFARTQGANLKPGVKGAADTPEKMRRKGSFLTRFFTNPSGPMVDEKGRATRLALSAAAWGERVPKNNEDAAKLAEKGRNLLERYANTKKKDAFEDIEEKAGLGPSIGAAGAASGTPGTEGSDGVDRDGDGVVFDGTDKETRAPYKRQSNAGYEKRRRQYVRSQLTRQGITMNANVQDRSGKERDARARARAAFDTQTRAAGARAQAEIGRATTEASRARRNEAASGRLQEQANRSSAVDRKPADRIDNSPPARRIDSAERVQANRGTPQASDAATRRGQTDSRRPTSADDRRRPDSVDKGTGNRVAGDQPVRVGRQEAQGTRDAATRRGQTDSRRPTSADDRQRPDSVDKGTGNRVAGDQPVRVGRQSAPAPSDASTRRGQTDSRRPTSDDDRKRPDSIDKPSGPRRRADMDSNPDPGFLRGSGRRNPRRNPDPGFLRGNGRENPERNPGQFNLRDNRGSGKPRAV